MLAAMLHSLSPTEELAAIARINEHYGTHMPLEPDAVLSRESLAALIYIVQNNAVHASAPQEVIQIETEPQQSWWMKLLPW